MHWFFTSMERKIEIVVSNMQLLLNLFLASCCVLESKNTVRFNKSHQMLALPSVWGCSPWLLVSYNWQTQKSLCVSWLPLPWTSLYSKETRVPHLTVSQLKEWTPPNEKLLQGLFLGRWNMWSPGDREGVCLLKEDLQRLRWFCSRDGSCKPDVELRWKKKIPCQADA